MAKTLQTCQKNHPGKFCASNNVHHKIEYLNSGGFNYECNHCGAKLLKSEYFGQASRCCHKGQVNMQDLYNTLQHGPQELIDLCDNTTVDGRKFTKDARKYNMEYAFGSIHMTSHPRMDPKCARSTAKQATASLIYTQKMAKDPNLANTTQSKRQTP
uniref:Uncharacterized protein n=1 Tax=Romanomermis culicivorax TaxID=13658 RepID=A0A915KKW2_ROMCU